MIGGEMRFVGNEDGEVTIQCQRRGCMVDRAVYGMLAGLNPRSKVWLEIPIPYDATPKDVDRIWHQHRIDHANREK